MWLYYSGLWIVMFLQVNSNGVLKAQVANLRQQGKGTYADFEGLVLKGFGQDLLKYTKYTQIEINNKMAVYNNFVSNPANVSPNFVSCP